MRGRRDRRPRRRSRSGSSPRSSPPTSWTPPSTALVDELAALSPLALAMAKRVLNHAYDGPLHLGLEIEGLAYGMLRSTQDFREGVEAFVEKRPPRYARERKE